MGLYFLNSRGGLVDIEDLKAGLIMSTCCESKVGADPEATGGNVGGSCLRHCND